MNMYLSEDEQIQKIKKWLKKNIVTLAVAVIVFMLASSGWNHWNKIRLNRSAQASILYDQVIDARENYNYDEVKLRTAHLQKSYAKTPYASLSSLIAARDAIIKKDLAGAEKFLRWVIDNGNDRGFRQIARLRLARIFIEQKRPHDAIELLKLIDDKMYLSNIHEINGDAYLASSNNQSAMHEYQLAIKTSRDAGRAYTIEMKLGRLL